LVLKRFPVNRFQKSTAQLPMDFHCGPDDGMGPCIFLVFDWHH
jgi:hypothetical protein